jgi:hypothetical protein
MFAERKYVDKKVKELACWELLPLFPRKYTVTYCNNGNLLSVFPWLHMAVYNENELIDIAVASNNVDHFERFL